MNETLRIPCRVACLLLVGLAAQAQTPYEAPPDTFDPTLRAAIERERQEGARIARQLDDALAAEEADLAFSEPTERKARRVVQAFSEKARVENLECKSTFCRTVIRFETGDERETFLEELSFLEPFHVGGFGLLDEDGKSLTLYFQRPGYELRRVSID